MTAEVATPTIRPVLAPARIASGRLAIVPLLLALILCFGSRYFFVFEYIGFDRAAHSIGGDAYAYVQIAYTLSKTGKFGELSGVDAPAVLRGDSKPASGPPPPVWLTAYRPPLWPYILAGILKLANYNLRYIFYLRWILDLLTLYLFSRLLSPISHAAIRHAILFAFAIHPAWLGYSSSFLSEPLTILIQIALTLDAVTLSQTSAGIVRPLGVGILCGLTVLQHPYYIFFPVFLIGGLWALQRINARSLLVISASMAMTIAPWLVRNMLVFRTVSPILTTSAGANLSRAWNASVLGLYRNTTAELLDKGIGTVDLTGVNEAERDKAYARAAVAFIETNWRLVPAIAARKLAGAVTPLPETRRDGILETGRTIFQVISLVPVVAVLCSKVAGRFRVVAVSLVLSYLVMGVLTLATVRYRFPLIWVEMMSAAIVIDWLFTRRFPLRTAGSGV